MSDPSTQDAEEFEPIVDSQADADNAQLWVISYSDFITILMIFFLMLFAHRVWEKKVAWEAERVTRLRAAQESQKGMVQRLARLSHVDVTAERINIRLPDALLFDAGQTDLRPDARVLLRDLAPDLATFDGKIVVEGHTDNLPPGGKSRYKTNYEISVARSFSVIQCLTGAGVPPEKLSARGYGEFRPRADNETPMGRAANRRIEMVLLNPRRKT